MSVEERVARVESEIVALRRDLDRANEASADDLKAVEERISRRVEAGFQSAKDDRKALATSIGQLRDSWNTMIGGARVLRWGGVIAQTTLGGLIVLAVQWYLNKRGGE